MTTVRKRNISGADLEVAVLDFLIVKDGDEADLPTHYPWSTDEDPAEIVWPETTWEDVAAAPAKAAKADNPLGV